MTYKIQFFKYLFINIVLFNVFKVAYSQTTSNVTKVPSQRHSEILSRRKRFLIFPEGSSLQLVFCLTYPTIFTIGDIFLLGNTAALAWELPQDPYSPYRHHADPLHRRVDSKTIHYTDDFGRTLFTKPYKRKLILNPAFAKRSASEPSNRGIFKKGTDSKMDRRSLHRAQCKRDFLKSELMDESNLYFHRGSRVGLYQKIEAMFKALGSDGRQCMLKSLCKFGQSQENPQGSFMEELLRAIFTLPEGPEFQADHHKEYDNARQSTESCDILYPGCDNLVLDPTLPLFSY